MLQLKHNTSSWNKLFVDSLSTQQQLLQSWYIFAFQPPGHRRVGPSMGGQLVRQVFTNDHDTGLDAWGRVLGKDTKDGTCLHECPG